MKFKSKFTYLYHIFISYNPLENAVWKMAAILSRPQRVNNSEPPPRVF